MKTDTSEFSLKEALSNIAGFNEVLTFKPLGYYVGGMPQDACFDDILNGDSYKFRTWPADVMMQSTLGLEDRVFRILVRREVQVADSPINGNVKYVWLILKRSYEGGSFLLPYVQEACFQFDRFMYYHTFNSVDSKVISLRHYEEFAEITRPPLDFPERFWKQVNEWVRVSTESRRKSIAELRKLSTACVIEYSKYAAKTLIEQTKVVRGHYAVKNP